MKKIASTLLFFFLFCRIFAQESSDNSSLYPRFGVFGLLGMDLHTANFQKFPGVPNCCPRYEKGQGLNYGFGLIFEQPISNIWIPGIKVLYFSRTGKLTTDENSFVSIYDKVTPAVIEHKFSYDFTYLGTEPYLALRAFESITILAGVHFGFLQYSHFEQEEVLKSPATQGTFENGLRSRNRVSGGIPNAEKIMIDPLIGIRCSFPLNSNRTFFLAPESVVYFSTKSVSKNIDWSINSLKLGLAFKYAPKPSEPLKEIFERQYLIDTLKYNVEDLSQEQLLTGKETSSKEKKEVGKLLITTEIIRRTDTLRIPKTVQIIAEVSAVGVDSDNNENPIATLKIEEFLSTNMFPVLNYVFFEDNSSQIPIRYNKIEKSESANFNIKQLFNLSTIESYYHLLNIIGFRMSKEPSTRIILTGCNSDDGIEKNNMELSENRANSVKKYLVNIWGIDEKRIETKFRNLPEKPSNTATEDGIAENRRVEIKSATDFPITSPVVISDTLRQSNPPTIRFNLNSKTDYEMKSWKLAILQDNQILKEFSGTGALPSSNEWKLNLEKSSLPFSGTYLQYFLEVTDIKNHRFVTDKKQILVEQKTITKKIQQQSGDKRIDKFSLILFDYDDRNLNKENLSIVKDIKKNIFESSDVLIEGFTDRIGEEDYNLQLSLDRAKAVEKSFNSIRISTKGYGSKNLPCSNDLPEGRFYSRTVKVTIETPLNEK